MKKTLLVGALITLLVVITIVLYYSLKASIIDPEGIVETLKGMGYAGAFVSGLLATSTLFLGVFPSYVIIPLLVIFASLNPLLVGMLAGLGAGLGQYLHYYVGVGGRYILSEKRRKSLAKWRPRLEKYGLWLILAFAMTPLTPDDLIWIPLGLVGYPKMKALLAAITGKIILNLVYAYVGYFFGESILDLLRNIPL
ncbi:MAG: VTT domain-containing protein [archaeon]|nr:VTT domain-containing protein [archaeon]MCP8320398.1 VTT domain-containing protein [archaeon]